jgi:hypothetical protein
LLSDPVVTQFERRAGAAHARRCAVRCHPLSGCAASCAIAPGDVSLPCRARVAEAARGQCEPAPAPHSRTVPYHGC